MARVPSDKEVKRIQEQSERAIERKTESQKEKGKDFVLPEGGGSGVIPERIWKKLPGKQGGEDGPQ